MRLSWRPPPLIAVSESLDRAAVAAVHRLCTAVAALLDLALVNVTLGRPPSALLVAVTSSWLPLCIVVGVVRWPIFFLAHASYQGQGSSAS